MKLGLRLAACLALLVAAAEAQAQPTEQAVKAAFIPKFARYVQWPAGLHPGPREPFQLCVVGHDPFGALLDRAAAGEQVEGRPVGVRRLPDPARLDGCHLAFVHGDDAGETRRMLLAMRNRPVLTITDARAGSARGMIHFTVAGGRVRFFIDQAEAEARGLSISSRLLALALGVRQRRS